jgi:hypothetical protein
MPVVTEGMMGTAATRMRIAHTRFVNEVTAWTKKVPPEQLGIIHRKMAFQAVTGVINRTPVDTGRARGNWMVDINRVPTGARAIGGERGPRVSKREASSISQREADKAIAKLKQNPFVATHITNNVEYIEFLEAGGSDQAPNGMVALTVLDLVTQFGGPVAG